MWVSVCLSQTERPARGKSPGMAMSLTCSRNSEEGHRAGSHYVGSQGIRDPRAFSSLASEGGFYFQGDGKLFENLKQRNDLI